MPLSPASSIAFREEVPINQNQGDTRINDSIVSISLQEEPSELHQDGKMNDSIASISLQEESNGEPEELQYDVGSAVPIEGSHSDDIEIQMLDGTASKSERSLMYEVEESRTNVNRLTSAQQQEGVAAPRPSHPSDTATAALTSAIYLLNPPPSRLSKRAAMAAQTPRLRTSAPITPRTRSPSSIHRPPAEQRQATEQKQDAQVQSLVPGSESAPTPETTVDNSSMAGAEPTPAGAAPIPTPIVTSARIPDVIVTEHRRYFPGDKWDSVVAASFDVVKETVRSETAAAIGVKPQYVQVLNVETTAAGMTCDISVCHAPSRTASEVDEKLSSYPYETTITLPDILDGACAPSERTPASQVGKEEREAPAGVSKRAPKAKRNTKKAKKLNKGCSAGTPPKKFRQKPLPQLLVTPRVYHYRSPRPGAERCMENGSILYLESPREGTVGPSNPYPTSTATLQGGINGVSAVNGSRSSSAPTHRSVSIGNSVHIPPQRVERGIVSMALHKSSITRAAAASRQQQQPQQRAMAAPSDDASAPRYMNGVERTANTRSVSRRSRSRSPQQLALAPGTDSVSDAASEEKLERASAPMAARGSAAEDDYALMTQGVEEAADAEHLLQLKRKAVAEYDPTDDEDDPVPTSAPNPFV
ncbi:hypothetical protein, conserved [Leishmania tarentolae]|uniref:Flagellar attachment zone protein 1 conserved domain-containing protein n=1 Tax=Leishmania tarentolae TaxID=5689 RepID=A0A640KIZ7_LEITA|nr:hypothetical protein, conserved [Leishmania tarentolae]